MERYLTLDGVSEKSIIIFMCNEGNVVNFTDRSPNVRGRKSQIPVSCFQCTEGVQFSV